MITYAVLKADGMEDMALMEAIIPGKTFGKQCKMATSHRKVITIREVMEATGVILVVTEVITTLFRFQV